MSRRFIKLLAVAFVAVVYAAPAWADTVVFSDTFGGSSIDSSKWTPITQGQQSDSLGGGAMIDAWQGGGVLTIAGFTDGDAWSGYGVKSIQTFNMSQQYTLSVDSVSVAALNEGGTYAAGLWVFIDSSHYFALRRSNEGNLVFSCRSGDWEQRGYDLIAYDDGATHNLKIVYTPGDVAGSASMDTYWDADLVATQAIENWTGTTFNMAIIGEGRLGEDVIDVSFANALVTTPAPVPEPGTLALLGCGLAVLLSYAWKKRK